METLVHYSGLLVLASSLLLLAMMLIERSQRHGHLKAEKRRLIEMYARLEAEREALREETALRSEIDGYRQKLGITPAS